MIAQPALRSGLCCNEPGSARGHDPPQLLAKNAEFLLRKHGEKSRLGIVDLTVGRSRTTFPLAEESSSARPLFGSDFFSNRRLRSSDATVSLADCGVMRSRRASPCRRIGRLRILDDAQHRVLGRRIAQATQDGIKLKSNFGFKHLGQEYRSRAFAMFLSSCRHKQPAGQTGIPALRHGAPHIADSRACRLDVAA